MAGLCNHSLELTALGGNPRSPVHQLDPRAKIVGLVSVTVVAVTAPLSAWPVWVGCVTVLVAVAAVAEISPALVWRRARFILPLVVAAAVLLPLVGADDGRSWAVGPLRIHEAGLAVLAAVLAKATIGIASAILLNATTTFPSTLRGLEAMHAPRLLVLIAGLMYRYMFVIVEEVGRMRASLAARSYRPRHVLGVGVLGRVATALFLRSYARGERVHLAMLSRGYQGRMPSVRPLSLERADLAFVLLVLSLLVPLRVLTGIAA